MSLVDFDCLSYFKTKLTALYQTLFTPLAKSKGSATKPVYTDANGNITACTYTLAQNVTASSKLTDTVTTVSISGSGNAVTDISANNGALTVTKGTVTATSVAWTNVTGKPSSYTPSTHTHSYLPLSGGTVTGQISKANTSKSWYNGRDGAAFKTVAESSPADNHYVPCWSAKSYQGSWDCGSYTGDILYFSYVTDTNYDSGNNVREASFYWKPDGTFNAATLSEGGTTLANKYQAKGSYAASSHTHSEYAAASHGNHVPTKETANNAKFLRNDNTWQTVTPANIGAAASSHTHSGYLSTTGTAAKATADASGNTITSSYGASLTITKETKSGDVYHYINLKSKSGAVLTKANYKTDYFSCGA